MIQMSFFEKPLVTARTLFTLVCSVLTILLLLQELYNFVITKPTSTSIDEKQLETADIPDVVVCIDPGFNKTALEKYGYSGTYYRGSMDGEKFVGWNGNGSKSSHEILEEVLLDGTAFHSLLRYVNFRRDNVDYVGADIDFKTLAFPYGRCISISPPKETLKSWRINSLAIVLNETAVEDLNFKSFKLWVYFMDKATSLQTYPDEMEMLGDPVKMDLFSEEPPFRSYKTQISKSVHVPGDPLLDCTIYTPDNSYHNCVKNEVRDTFTREIGCMPPFLDADLTTLCNEKFNVSKKRDNEINKLFRSFYNHDRNFDCRTPCTKTIYTSRFIHSSPSRFKSSTLVVIFDKTIKMVYSTFSVDGRTLLIRLGGSV